MRKMTSLISLLMLFLAFSGTAQTIKITGFSDSALTSGNCVDTNTKVEFEVSGSYSDTSRLLNVNADFDDGQGFNRQGQVRSDRLGNFNYTFNHSFSKADAFKVQVAVNHWGATPDTSKLFVKISDDCGKIAGKVYLDKSNNNCQYDNAEPLLGSRAVKLFNQNNLVGYGLTQKNGHFQFNIDTSQSYTVKMFDTVGYGIDCPSSATISVSDFPDTSVNFGLKCKGNNDFKVASANAVSFRPGVAGKIALSLDGIANCSTDTISCMKVILNNKLRTNDSLYGNSFNGPKFSSKNGDTVKWNLKQYAFPDFRHTDLPLVTRTSASIGDTLCYKVIICTNDNDVSNDTLEKCVEVVNAYDPNNKVVKPAGKSPNNYIKAGQKLNYTINFQNTGNATAFNVRVEDTLDADLDLNTLEVVGSSHPMNLTIENQNILKFNFNNIDLPDSNTNEPASHGYVRFTIDHEASISKGTKITNEAGIYFDQNPPIVTNETLSTICEPSNATIRPRVCGSYTAPGNQKTWSQSGTYYDTITNSFGCDSIIKINLTVNQSSSSSIQATACDSYTVPSGDETYTAGGTYYDTVNIQQQCDSVIKIDLTINSLDTGLTVLNNPFTLKAEDTSANYQWLNCNTNNPIPGNTNQTFTPSQDGYYGVALTKNACQDTSGCINYRSSSTNQPNANTQLRVFPNPSSDKVTISWNANEMDPDQMQLVNTNGQALKTKNVIGKSQIRLSLEDLDNGIYFLKIRQDDKMVDVKKLIKQ